MESGGEGVGDGVAEGRAGVVRDDLDVQAGASRGEVAGRLEQGEYASAVTGRQVAGGDAAEVVDAVDAAGFGEGADQVVAVEVDEAGFVALVVAGDAGRERGGVGGGEDEDFLGALTPPPAPDVTIPGRPATP
ncbi:hypothetical protein, partial [Streptomyces sp. V2]|uniref:hypothetical protein n=1 Tax=Streptomyces sp. V2 TaxID=1424099 RepID=UPI0019CF5F2B